MPKKSSKNVSIDTPVASPESDPRSRTWATIVYPESSPDFLDKIADSLLECFVSPLHEDIDEDTLLEKKPHYHVEIKFSTKKSQTQVLEAVKAFGGVGAERINDFRAYARYLCHLDQPNKRRYDTKDVQAFGGLDYLSTIEAVADKYVIVGEIMDYCDEHYSEIRNSFARLLRAVRPDHPEWFRHLCDDCGYIIKEYLQSAEWDRKEDLNRSTSDLENRCDFLRNLLNEYREEARGRGLPLDE